MIVGILIKVYSFLIGLIGTLLPNWSINDEIINNVQLALGSMWKLDTFFPIGNFMFLIIVILSFETGIIFAKIGLAIFGRKI